MLTRPRTGYHRDILCLRAHAARIANITRQMRARWWRSCSTRAFAETPIGARWLSYGVARGSVVWGPISANSALCLARCFMNVYVADSKATHAVWRGAVAREVRCVKDAVKPADFCSARLSSILRRYGSGDHGGQWCCDAATQRHSDAARRRAPRSRTCKLARALRELGNGTQSFMVVASF